MNGLLVALWMALQLEGTGVCPAASEVEAEAGTAASPWLCVGIGRSGDHCGRRRRHLVGLARAAGRNIHCRATFAAVDELRGTGGNGGGHARCLGSADSSGDLAAARPAGAASAGGRPRGPDRRQEVVVRKREPPASAPARSVAVGAAVVGAGVIGSGQPTSVAPGGRIDATLDAAGWPLRWRLSASALGKHQESLPPGEADWWRLYVALGADYLIPLGRRWELSLGAAGVLGVASVEGNGFMVDRAAESTDWGSRACCGLICASARSGPGWGWRSSRGSGNRPWR